MTATIGMTIDCVNLEAAAAFWKETLGYDEPIALTDDAQFHPLVSPGGGLHHLTLQRVPEAKSGKNRAHLDLFVADRAAEVERLQGLGGTITAEHHGDYRTTIMADPEGNEFCVVQQH